MVGVGDKSVIVRIHGRVQGVWFRAWTMENAVTARPARLGPQPRGRQCGGIVLRAAGGRG